MEYSLRISSLLKRTKDAISAKYPGGDEGLKKKPVKEDIAAFK